MSLLIPQLLEIEQGEKSAVTSRSIQSINQIRKGAHFPQRSAPQIALPSVLIHFHARPSNHSCIIGAQLNRWKGELDVLKAAGCEEGAEPIRTLVRKCPTHDPK